MFSLSQIEKERIQEEIAYKVQRGQVSNCLASYRCFKRILIPCIGVIIIALSLVSVDASASNAIDKHVNQARNAKNERFVVSSMPKGTENIDTPLKEYAAFTGTIDVATGGISLFPVKTANSFEVEVPACENGDKPIIHAAYLEWYQRWRGPMSVANSADGSLTFDDDIDVDINNGGSNSFVVMSSSWGRFNMVKPAKDKRVFVRRNALANVTDHFDANWIDGDNLIAVSGLQTPTPATFSNSDNYGVAVHVFFECPEFDYSRVGFSTGLDWFYGTQLQPYVGRYSDLSCFEFPTAIQPTHVDIDSILGGQAHETAPFRGARLFYKTGSGAIPTVNSGQATGPNGVIADGGTQIEAGYQAIWTSSLGHEWDQYNAENAIAINAGDEWVCLQAESAKGEGSANGISGDLFSVAYSIQLESPTDWGDLPEEETHSLVIEGTTPPPSYNTNILGTAGPSHPIIPTLQIGPSIDDEGNGQPNVMAEGDNFEAENDEDGIRWDEPIKPGAIATFTGTVTNTTGFDAYLYGFVDWNGDGDFDDQSEFVRKIIPSGSINFSEPFTYSVPITDSVRLDTNLGVRFRLSTDSGLGPDGPATNGEVEDYVLLIPTAVELTYFNVSRTGHQQATLHWATAVEIDNFGFRVLRSPTGLLADAEEIAFVPSSIEGGNGPGDRYMLIDDLPNFGRYTYWLVDVDTAGIETLNPPQTVAITRDWQVFIPFVVES